VLAAVVLGAALLLPSASVATAVEAACSTGGWFFTYQDASTSNISANRTGVSASLQVNGEGFRPCTGASTNAGPSAWVAIVPKVYVDGTQIIQIGITECINILLPGVCGGNGNPHFFWAKGGCGATGSPTPMDLGPADTLLHDYVIYLDYDNYWHFLIDGVQRAAIPYNDGSINCWVDGLRKAEWAFERHNIGDSSGDPSGVSKFYYMKYGRYGLGWFDPMFTNGWCQYPYIEDEVCTITNGHHFENYTTH